MKQKPTVHVVKRNYVLITRIWNAIVRPRSTNDDLVLWIENQMLPLVKVRCTAVYFWFSPPTLLLTLTSSRLYNKLHSVSILSSDLLHWQSLLVTHGYCVIDSCCYEYE